MILPPSTAPPSHCTPCNEYPEVHRYGHMTTGHSVEAWTFLTKGAYALSSHALTCAALIVWARRDASRCSFRFAPGAFPKVWVTPVRCRDWFSVSLVLGGHLHPGYLTDRQTGLDKQGSSTHRYTIRCLSMYYLVWRCYLHAFQSSPSCERAHVIAITSSYHLRLMSPVTQSQES